MNSRLHRGNTWPARKTAAWISRTRIRKNLFFGGKDKLHESRVNLWLPRHSSRLAKNSIFRSFLWKQILVNSNGEFADRIAHLIPECGRNFIEPIDRRYRWRIVTQNSRQTRRETRRFIGMTRGFFPFPRAKWNLHFSRHFGRWDTGNWAFLRPDQDFFSSRLLVWKLIFRT